MIKRIAAGLACVAVSTIALAGIAPSANAIGHTVRCHGSTAHIYGSDGTYYGWIADSVHCRTHSGMA